MKELVKDIWVSMVMGLVIPGMLLNFAAMVWNRAVASVEAEPVQQTVSVKLPVKVRRVNAVTAEDMDTYLVGVVLQEMPASFEKEALKAQAVVARTYARKAYLKGGKHGDGSVCTDPSCCQAWISEEEYLQQGGTQDAVEKIRAAVMETSGQVLTYEGELIEATYFSCSGGRTEDAVAVWGTEFSYLQAVDSPGEEEASVFTDTVTVSAADLEDKLQISLAGNPGNWVGQITYTNGGGVDTVVLGGKYFTGLELRKKLGLRSTAFSLSASEDGICFTTKGYGHRVGMSQYGTDAMALAGSTYAEILSHYYQGTELIQLGS